MIKRKFFLFPLLLIALLTISGCQLNESTGQTTAAVSPSPAATQAEIITEDTILPTSTQNVPATPVVNPSNQEATPEIITNPTETPTETPTTLPTETPIPTNPVDSITLVPIIEGALILPLYLTHAGDDRLFVIEQAGVIRIIDEAGALLETPFLDIRDRVGSTQLEQGLLGLAFHPDYKNTGAFFVNYTNLAGDTHISRFMVEPGDPNRANPDSETLLLSFEQPFPNHNGGQIAFGPDGYLYIGVGDGGSANDPLNSGQDLGTLLGTILRLEVDPSGTNYGIPVTNPFVENETGRGEVWAWGLRNPWRFSFDRLTGDLFIADVGQNLWEEIHFQQADSPGGENYGWNILEGSHCFLGNPCDSTGLEYPIFEYSHEEGCSITGGYMYRGAQYLDLYGNYFVADFCQGTIWRLFQEKSGSWIAAVVYDSPYVISSFGEDAAGELYVIDHTGGSIYQLRP